MGRKRSWKVERILLYLAGCLIILASTSGCALFSVQKKQTTPPEIKLVSEMLASAETAMVNGDYDLALQQNDDILTNHPGILEDQVLYQRGVIHVHPRNPEQNTMKAMDLFRMLKEKYPGSGLGTEADGWIAALEGNLHKDHQIAAMKKEIQKHEKTIAQLNAQANSRQAQMKQMTGQISQLETRIRELEGKLEKLKKIDLGIEEKKRMRTEP